MLILHGAVVDRQFVVWGETPPVPGMKWRPKTNTARDGVSPLPFAAKRSELSAALLQIFAKQQVQLPPSHRYILWVPTINGQPVAHGKPLARGTSASVAPWSVMGIALEPIMVNYLLAQDPSTFGKNIQLSVEMVCWSMANVMLFRLIRQRQMLPELDLEPDETWQAHWKPIFEGSDRAMQEELARSLPGVALAMTAQAEIKPVLSPMATLERFIGILLDDYIRDARINPQRLVKEAAGQPQPGAYYPAYGYDPYGHIEHPPFDAWVNALTRRDFQLRGTTVISSLLADHVHDWQDRRYAAPPLDVRLCLRLEEPPDPLTDEEPSQTAPEPIKAVSSKAPKPPEEPWRVRLLLQSISDPSLQVEVGSLHSASLASTLGPGATPATLRLALIQEASKYIEQWPALNAALEGQSQGTVELDAMSAYAFLTETATNLISAGCLVQLPSWWIPSKGKQRMAVKAHVFSKSDGPGFMGEAALLQVNWQAALGDKPISAQELQRLAALKAPLVRVRGQWMHVNPEDIQAALQFLKKRGQAQTTLSEVARLALDSEASINGLPVAGVDVEAASWVGALLDKLRHGNTSLATLPPPPGLHAQLRPYQERGFSWLSFLTQFGLGACLADDMGLGKTLMTLTLIQRDWEAQPGRPILIVCPTSVIGNWRREAERFTPDLPVMIHHGGTRRKEDRFIAEAKQHAIVITSYGLVLRDLDQLQQIPWRGVILDEAQNIKNPETKQTQAAHQLRGDYRIALTGTPVENSVTDLWSIMEFLNPDLLGSQSEFRRLFSIPIQVNQDQAAVNRLRQLTGPFILRRMKTDPTIIADLPEKEEMPVYCSLTKEQASLYAAVLRHMEEQLATAEGIQRRGIIVATLTKLKQICNHPAHFLGDHSRLPGRSGKLMRLDEMLEEALAEGDHALIFTQFAEMGELLRGHLQTTLKREIPFLHGGVPQAQREVMIANFQQAEGGPPIFILSLKAGGLGLNLTRANHVFHFDRWWNPAVENQATDRAFRIGQTRRVQVHKFICMGTLEERINTMIEQKEGIAANVVGSGEGWLTELSTEQLRDIFALRPEAVAI